MPNRTREWLLAGVAAVLAWSVIANLVLGDGGYLWRNLALSVLLLLGARASGLAQNELGLSRADASSGLLWGVASAGLVAVAILGASLLSDAFPVLDVLLSDERADLTGAALVFAVLVRIPLGTALFEELLFRGVLYAALRRQLDARHAMLTSSVVFGLWHVAPTMVALSLNDVAPLSPAGIAAILSTVVVTTAGGLAFVWLRLRSGSLIAPVLAHWATNAFGLLAAAAT